MEMYRKMYAILCAAASEAVDFIRNRQYILAEYELLRALQQAEEIYLNADEGDGEGCPDVEMPAQEVVRFEEIMKAWAVKQGEHYQALNEQLRNDPSAAVPEDVHRRMLETINKAYENRQEP